MYLSNDAHFDVANHPQKNPPQRVFSKHCKIGLRILDVRSLLAFWTLCYFELYFLTFFQSLEAIHLDRGEVGEQILTAIIRSDKTKALGVIEPFYGTCCHNTSFKYKLITRAEKARKLYKATFLNLPTSY